MVPERGNLTVDDLADDVLVDVEVGVSGQRRSSKVDRVGEHSLGYSWAQPGFGRYVDMLSEQIA